MFNLEKAIGAWKKELAKKRSLEDTYIAELEAVLLANVVAWPAAYFAVGKWLQEFAYRIRPGLLPAVIAAAFSLFVALLAVGAKAVRAAAIDPARCLRDE